MKKKICVLISLFILCVLCLACFSACGGEQTIEDVYQTYVTNANENGKTPLTYEKWLEEIKRMQEIKEVNKMLMDELVEDIVIDCDRNIKIIFKCEDKYFEALDFINKHKCDIIAAS